MSTITHLYDTPPDSDRHNLLGDWKRIGTSARKLRVYLVELDSDYGEKSAADMLPYQPGTVDPETNYWVSTVGAHRLPGDDSGRRYLAWMRESQDPYVDSMPPFKAKVIPDGFFGIVATYPVSASRESIDKIAALMQEFCRGTHPWIAVPESIQITTVGLQPERFEYKVIAAADSTDGMLELLNRLGAEGWELVGNNPHGVSHTYIVKRRLRE